MDVLIGKKRTRLSSSKIIGAGGEAEIYDIGGGMVAKIFKSPSHADFKGDATLEKMAESRIQEHQKKLRVWPRTLPKNVMGPEGLVTDLGGKKVLGYTMQFLQSTEVLLKYGERKYRESHAIEHNDVVKLFTNLHRLVTGVHAASTVIGDFNDLNVLVDKAMQPYLVDADSMQFGGFLSRVFTARFVDPLLCDTNRNAAYLIHPHNTHSDWYAYAVMLMQSLLYVHPYGGVHAPADVGKKLRDWARTQKRVSVFSPEVVYPKPAIHYSVLPDTLLDQFARVFQKDERGVFPFEKVERLIFTTCPLCKKWHARSSCPDCQPTPPSMVKEIITGSIEALKVLDTSGRILYAITQGGIPKYVYHENGSYYREGARKIMDGKLDADIRFRIHGEETILAKAGACIAMKQDGMNQRFVADLFRGKVTMVDANQKAIFVVSNGTVQKFKTSSMDYSQPLGAVLSSQTLLWVSDTLGFIFSRAGEFSQSYVFRTDGSNLGQDVDFPGIKGQILDATTIIAENYLWFLIATSLQGKRINRAYMFDRFGMLIAQEEALHDDGTWLSNIRGKCAFGKQLFSPSDDGIERVEAVNGTLCVTKNFSDTGRFVDSSSKLLFGNDGIYVVSAEKLWRLRLK